MSVLPTRDSQKFGTCLAGCEQLNWPTLMRCCSLAQTWCRAARVLCMLCAVISASHLPLPRGKAGAGLLLLFWSQHKSPAAGASRMLSLLSACSGLCCGDERLHRRMSEVWELLGLTCTERGGKKMEVFFFFLFSYFFLFCWLTECRVAAMCSGLSCFRTLSPG